MKHNKTLVAIFAHPDDEAFGPAGYLIKATQEYDVHVICVTDGALGKAHPEDPDLISIRKKELKASAEVIGLASIHFLHFEDGCLSNRNYHDIAEKIGTVLDRLKPETLLTFEPRGISGHLDHIAVTSVTSYLFYKKDYAKRLLYHVMHQDMRNKFDDYFVFMPPGYSYEQIDLTINIEDVWDKKKQAILCHVSQKGDSSRMLRNMENLPKEEHFLEILK